MALLPNECYCTLWFKGKSWIRLLELGMYNLKQLYVYNEIPVVRLNLNTPKFKLV